MSSRAGTGQAGRLLWPSGWIASVYLTDAAVIAIGRFRDWTGRSGAGAVEGPWETYFPIVAGGIRGIIGMLFFLYS